MIEQTTQNDDLDDLFSIQMFGYQNEVYFYEVFSQDVHITINTFFLDDE